MNYTQEEILKLLIKYYQDSIDNIEVLSGVNDIKDYLRVRYIYSGICNCAHKVFNQDIYNEKWIGESLRYLGPYWHSLPISQPSKEDILNCLYYRLNKMKGILNDLIESETNTLNNEILETIDNTSNDDGSLSSMYCQLKSNYGLMEIELNHHKTLLVSCENALSERDLKLAALRQSHNELLEALEKIIKLSQTIGHSTYQMQYIARTAINKVKHI